jgi:prevent-host-death family protein
MKGDLLMPNIVPVSDLRNYTEVLNTVAAGEPVFLTKNGHGRYVVEDMDDYDRKIATIKLLTALAKGKRSGDTQGWFSLDEVAAELGMEE